jgi:hypothetical protein
MNRPGITWLTWNRPGVCAGHLTADGNVNNNAAVHSFT